RFPDLLGVVLDPARLWEVLLELAVAARAQLERLVEHEHRRARGSLIDRHHETRHRLPLLTSFVGESPPTGSTVSYYLLRGLRPRVQRYRPNQSAAWANTVSRSTSSVITWKPSCSVIFLYSLVPRRLAIASMFSYGTVWSCSECMSSVGVLT